MASAAPTASKAATNRVPEWVKHEWRQSIQSELDMFTALANGSGYTEVREFAKAQVELLTYQILTEGREESPEYLYVARSKAWTKLKLKYPTMKCAGMPG